MQISKYANEGVADNNNNNTANNKAADLASNTISVNTTQRKAKCG